MINIQITWHNDIALSLISEGHSNYDFKGKDIVCAGVSAIIIGGLNAMDEFAKGMFSYEVRDGFTKINLKENKEVQDVFKVMLIQLKTIEESYKKFIKIVEIYK